MGVRDCLAGYVPRWARHRRATCPTVSTTPSASTYARPMTGYTRVFTQSTGTASAQPNACRILSTTSVSPSASSRNAAVVMKDREVIHEKYERAGAARAGGGGGPRARGPRARPSRGARGGGTRRAGPPRGGGWGWGAPRLAPPAPRRLPPFPRVGGRGPPHAVPLSLRRG